MDIILPYSKSEIILSPVEKWVAEGTGILSRSAAELEAWQLGKAWETLEYARENSEYYRESLAACHGGGDYERWLSVPFLEGDALEDSRGLVCTPKNDVARIVQIESSGTRQGKKLYFGEEDLEATADFFAHGMSAMVEAGGSVAVFMRGQEEHTIGGLLKKGLERFGASCRIVWPITDYAAAAEEAAGCGCFVGTPGFTLQLAQRYPALSPKTVLLSADYIPDSVARRIEKLWNCQVLAHYGMTETGYGCAVQCPGGDGQHIRSADFMIEIIDPETLLPVGEGQSGEIVLTTLRRRAVPLVRYRTGDIASLITDACKCGGRFARLGRVEGRYADRVTLPRGTKTCIQELDEKLFSIEGLLDYRVSRDKDGRLMFDIQTTRGADIENSVRALFPGEEIFISLCESGFGPGFKKRQIGEWEK